MDPLHKKNIRQNQLSEAHRSSSCIRRFGNGEYCHIQGIFMTRFCSESCLSCETAELCNYRHSANKLLHSSERRWWQNQGAVYTVCLSVRDSSNVSYSRADGSNSSWVTLLLLLLAFTTLLRVLASTFLRFRDHTDGHTTVGRTPLDEWSARRRDFYLTKHNTYNRQTSMPPAGFEPAISAGDQPQTLALDRSATGIGGWVTQIT
jgi:hypothetical protein